jgi:hypothetical protein
LQHPNIVAVHEVGLHGNGSDHRSAPRQVKKRRHAVCASFVRPPSNMTSRQ